MVKSIRFTAASSRDYINDIHYKEVPNPNYENEKKNRWSRASAFNLVEDGYENLVMRKCVLDRVFEFDEKRINIIFGPNASGKSTILNTIAHYSLCGKGSNSFGQTGYHKFEPFDFVLTKGLLRNDECTQEDLVELIHKNSGNEAVLEWDGSCVYHPLVETNAGYGGELGDMEKCGFSFLEEAKFRIERNKMSTGFAVLGQIRKIANICATAVRVLDENDAPKNYNDVFRRVFELQRDYIKSRINGDPGKPTVMLDEIDKSLDIINTVMLYRDYLPTVVECTGVQMLLVSHNPIMMTNVVYGNPEVYNFISMDDEYTEKVKKSLDGVKFN